MDLKINKQDKYLILGIIAIALLLILGIWMTSTAGIKVVISVGEEIYQKVPISKDDEILIETKSGTNRVFIQDGEVWMEEASCPDKVCVHQGKIHHTGELIVCMPNQVVITIEGE